LRSNPPGIGSHQILDLANPGTVTCPPAALTGISFIWTQWPLLPNTAYRFYNAFLNLKASVAQLVALQNIAIAIILLDGGNNFITDLGLGAENYTEKTWISNGAGPSLAAAGDPIAEFFGGMNVQGQTTGANPPAFFLLSYTADVFNTDAAAHTVTAEGSCIFSSVPFA
jgi:hypothetical protein